MNVEEEKEELGLPGKRRIGVTLGNKAKRFKKQQQFEKENK